MYNQLIQLVKISETEYLNTTENGFEIIHKETKDEPRPKVKEQVRTRIVEPKNIPESKPFQTKPKDFNDVLSTAFNEAILPSKSPLPHDDSFNYLTSINYLRIFIIASSVFIFAISVFN